MENAFGSYKEEDAYITLWVNRPSDSSRQVHRGLQETDTLQ
jgi:hypothetical protein